MTKRFLIVSLIVVVVIAAMVAMIANSIKRSGKKELTEYKAKLRAQGEILSWDQLGYPKTNKPNDCQARLVKAADAIPEKSFSFQAGIIAWMDFTSPTNPIPCWKKTELPLRGKKGGTVSWNTFEAVMDSIDPQLCEIRAALTNPPPRLWENPEDLLNFPKYPSVQQRKAAQWLSADAIYAVRLGEFELLRDDMRGLFHLMQMYKEDPVILPNMIRVAIAGLGLQVTAVVLASPGWTEPGLAEMQDGWSRVNLLTNLINAITGERIFSGRFFNLLDTPGDTNRAKILSRSFGGSGQMDNDLKSAWDNHVALPVFMFSKDSDELFVQKHLQSVLENLRNFSREGNWRLMKEALKSQMVALHNEWDHPLGSISHPFSRLLLTDISKSFASTVRTETMRRLAVIAIAIRRCELMQGAPPLNLDALVPGFLGELPVDPMTGKPFRYRVYPFGGFTLYSVGEDGIDDGGDSMPAKPTKDYEIWLGKDFVWPSVR